MVNRGDKNLMIEIMGECF